MTVIALIGQVGRALAEEWLPRSHGLLAWDVALAEPASPAARNARDLGVVTAGSAVAAVEVADLVVSAVTAANRTGRATSRRT